NCWRWQTHITLQDSTLAVVLDKLLNASSQERYSSAQEALNALTSGPPTSPPAQQTTSGPTGAPARPPTVASSGPKPVRPWMLGLVLLAVLGGGWWWFGPRGQSGINSAQVSIEPAASFRDVDVPQGQFTYGGSTTWAPIRGIVDARLQQAIPGLQLLYQDPVNQPPGTSAGIQMLLNGQLDFAQTSRPLTPEEKRQAEQQGLMLQEIPVAVEGVAVVTHPEVSLTNVSQAQLRDIYTGQLTNWQQLGGRDLPIVPISRNDEGGTVQFFSQTVLGGSPLTSSVRRSDSTTKALRLTANTPGAVYFASAPEVIDQCTIKPLSIDQQPPYQPPYVDLQNCPSQRNQPNLNGFASGDYPLTREIYIVSNADVPIGQAYAALLLSDEGQTALNAAGFARLQ
ncbi:MAG: substrate-binding domain-containing protein, partial [Cyanobacteria bacterium P01_H01_bin.26]